MAITFDSALGIHPYSVGVRSKRAEILASNLANANTPGYKAQDIDFKSMLQAASAEANVGLNHTNGRHFNSNLANVIAEQKLFRIPNQPDTGDGNTVDVQIERNLFMQNALAYQASLDFLGSKFKSLSKALKGE